MLDIGRAIEEVRTILKEQGREEAFIGSKAGKSTGIIITRGDTFFIGDLYH